MRCTNEYIYLTYWFCFPGRYFCLLPGLIYGASTRRGQQVVFLLMSYHGEDQLAGRCAAGASGMVTYCPRAHRWFSCGAWVRNIRLLLSGTSCLLSDGMGLNSSGIQKNVMLGKVGQSKINSELSTLDAKRNLINCFRERPNGGLSYTNFKEEDYFFLNMSVVVS